MSNKWTPGPWKADGSLVWAHEQHSAPALYGARREYSDGRLDARGRKDCYGPLCDTNDGEYVESRNPEADAHLIAAAPELLAACEALLASHRPGLGQCCKASDLGIAALAKARGEA